MIDPVETLLGLTLAISVLLALACAWSAGFLWEAGLRELAGRAALHAAACVGCAIAIISRSDPLMIFAAGLVFLVTTYLPIRKDF